MNIPESRFFVINNQAVIPTLIFKRNLTLEELGAFCVISATGYCWWDELEEVAEALDITEEKATELRDALVEKNCMAIPSDLPTDEEQAEVAASVYEDFRENLDQE
ncbi:TPA: hypothetical protein P0E30_003722 [Vibrio harveyi]|nr:hypothetical protein [Vibrio harveyi]